MSKSLEDMLEQKIEEIDFLNRRIGIMRHEVRDECSLLLQKIIELRAESRHAPASEQERWRASADSMAATILMHRRGVS